MENLIGKRIRCISMENDPHPIESGSEGTIIHVGGGVINVDWDNGRGLGLIIGKDKYQIKMKTVQFVSAKPYLNVSDTEFNKLLYCMSGRREVVVLCDDELKEILRNLPSDYYIPRLKDFKTYLKANGIEWTEDFKGTTTV